MKDFAKVGHPHGSGEIPTISAISPDTEIDGGRQNRQALDRLAPFILFGLYVVPQLLRALAWDHADFGPFSFLDELLYKRNAESIFRGLPYHSFHYPPLYPLVLSAAFWFPSSWYEAMLLINAVIASTVVFPIWWISRAFLTFRQSWMVLLIVILLPYGFAYPPILWSENLFIPLLCLAIYLGVIADLQRPVVSYLYGCTIAGLWATRYIAVSLLPVLAFAWVCRGLGGEGRRTKVARPALTLSALGGGFATILIPWILYGLFSSNSLRTILFGSYSLTKTSASATLSSLGFWTASYLAYLVLAMGPVLPWVMLVKIRSGSRCRAARLLLLTGLMVGALTVASVHHSWRHGYNYPDPFHLLGRYLTVAMPIIFCAGIVSLVLATGASRQSAKLRVAIAVTVSAGLLFLSRAVLFGNLLRELRPDFARTSFNSPDTYGRDAWWIFFLMLLAVTIPLLLFVRSPRAGTIARAAWITVTGTMLLSCGIEVAGRTTEHGMIGRHSRILAQTIERLKIDPSKHIAVISEIPPSQCSANRLAVGGKFFEVPESIGVSNEYGCIAATSAFVLRVSPKPPASSQIGAYRVFGQPYYISLVQTEPSETVPCILNWGPHSTFVHTSFNTQPDGGAAMWIQGRNFTNRTHVRFGDTVLQPSLTAPDLLALRVPERLYDQVGQVEIVLYQEDDTSLESDPVWFVIKPRAGTE